MEEIDVKKTKYFVIAIIILIVLSIILIIHFNNKKMVNGDEINTTKTTTKSDIIPITTTTITTKKVKVNSKKEEVQEEVILEELENVETIYKSIIDQNNSLIYNYKLTDEISNNDTIISTKLNISEELKNKNIIGLFDISLYDDMLNKKSVSNSLINIKIPIKDELIGYDEYKIIYINDNNEITNEEFIVKFENNYIEFETTHLSIFGIIGIKDIVENIPEEIIPEVKPDEEIKEDIDLSEVDVVLNINDLDYSYDKDNTLLLSKSDKLSIKVTGIDYEYQIYYSLISENMGNDYEIFNDSVLKDLPTNIIYNLKLKIVVEDKFVEFDMGHISVYDIIYINDREKVEEPIGFIEGEDNKVKPYYETDENKDIVIDNGDKVIINKNEEELDGKLEDADSNNQYVNNNLEKENAIEENNDSSPEVDENDIKVKINGNIYLVEETDISNLEMTGYLIIDTRENIIFDNYDVFENLYTITIRSREFTLNGTKYIYEYDGENIVIRKYVEPDEKTEEDIEKEPEEVEITIEDFKSIFDNNFNELVIEKDKTNQNNEQSSEEETKEIEETTVENNLNDEEIDNYIETE